MREHRQRLDRRMADPSRRWVRGAAALLGSGAALAGTGQAGAANGPTTPANQLIVGSGSQAAYNAVQNLDNLFNDAPSCQQVVASGSQPLDFSCVPSNVATNPASPATTPENPFGDVALEEPPLGANAGITQLEDQGSDPGDYGAAATVPVADNVSWASSSRGASASDVSGLNFVAYAEDGVSWAHFTAVKGVATPSANVASLSQGQLQGIFSGSINNWDQVGGKNAPIIVFGAPIQSGTLSTWKTFLGFNPDSGQQVNCADPGTVGPTSSSGYTGCVGPVIITQDEDAQILRSSFLSTQQSYFTSSPSWARVGATKLAAATSAGATRVTVSSAKGIETGYTVTIESGSKTDKAPVSSISGNILTLGKALKFVHTAGTKVNWKGPGVAPSDAAVRADAIFYTSAGVYYESCKAGQAENPPVDTCGASPLPSGTTNALGQINGATPTEASILENSFPVVRFLYTVYNNGSNSKLGPVTSNEPATLNFASEDGFICKPQNAQVTDPNSGRTYLSEIQDAISSAGFYPLSAGAVTGTVNSLPIDEGSVNVPADLLLSGTSYDTYDNTRHSQLAGGPQYAANGDPMGFCEASASAG